MGYHKNPLQIDLEDRYLRRIGDIPILDEASPSLKSFYTLCLIHPGVQDSEVLH